MFFQLEVLHPVCHSCVWMRKCCYPIESLLAKEVYEWQVKSGCRLFMVMLGAEAVIWWDDKPDGKYVSCPQRFQIGGIPEGANKRNIR